jgi:hypothetical protein
MQRDCAGVERCGYFYTTDIQFYSRLTIINGIIIGIIGIIGIIINKLLASF